MRLTPVLVWVALLAGCGPGPRHVAASARPLPPPDKARLAEATKLVARLDKLNDSENARLVKLGDEAFVALLPDVKHRLVLSQRRTADWRTDLRNWDSLKHALKMLERVALPQREDEIVKLWTELGPEAGGPLLQVLAAIGDDKLVPFFARQVGSGGAPNTAMDFFRRQRGPNAVRFLIGALRDSKADPGFRRAAYVMLPGTGDAGVQAVLSLRDATRSVPSLADEMELDKLGRSAGSRASGCELLAVHADWGLIASPVLGADGDLWIVRWNGGRWTNPLFAGQFIPRRSYSRTPVRILGMSVKHRVERGGWVKAFVDKPELARDSDGDGWTDVVERRLGTDPHNPDTDGDGLKDSVDRNPLAASPAVSDEELVRGAAFETVFKFEPIGGRPCFVLLPKGTIPFEMFGPQWLVLTYVGNWPKTPAPAGGQGAPSVTFGGAFRDFDGRRRTDPWASGNLEAILWNRDRTEAKLGIGVGYGPKAYTGYDVRVRKFGKHWLVVELTPVMAA